MSWTAVVPLKHGADRKTRLASRLSAEARAALSDRMAAHVIAVLQSVPQIGSVRLLSPVMPGCESVIWEADRGAGLNAELDRVCRAMADAPTLLIHADLPLLAPDDIIALLAAAEARGAAIAPDRHGRGTNALALAHGLPVGGGVAFGAESFARHRLLLGNPAVVRREGLMLDIDEPDDLDHAERLGVVD